LVAPYGSGPAANNNNNAWGTTNTPMLDQSGQHRLALSEEFRRY
jgi:hypothetical protein